MNTSELPLFELGNSISKPVDVIIPPNSQDNLLGIYDKVNTYFQEQDSDLKNVDFLREILGDKASQLRDFELANYSTEVLCLVEQWSEEFEEHTFGKTLRELLGTK